MLYRWKELSRWRHRRRLQRPYHRFRVDFRHLPYPCFRSNPNGTNVNLVGFHCDARISEDDPSQMGLEDIAFSAQFREVPSSTRPIRSAQNANQSPTPRESASFVPHARTQLFSTTTMKSCESNKLIDADIVRGSGHCHRIRKIWRVCPFLGLAHAKAS